LAEQLRGTYPERLTRAGVYLTGLLDDLNRPVIAPFELFELIRRMFSEQEGKKLYLREVEPTAEVYARLRTNLKKSGIIAPDRDYGARMFRIVGAADLPADEIVCLSDPTSYISHLSALQRWGLTERTSNSLIITRPDRVASSVILKGIVENRLGSSARPLIPLRRITHPEMVRRRSITVYETKFSGNWVQVRGAYARLSTIGQTFLDTLQKPDYCGGMSHVLDIWQEHAEVYRDEIIRAVDDGGIDILKSRAGYILEERLGLHDERIEAWKLLGQRGSSRKLDPHGPFASQFSETWMISLNV
jgi:predicted transcriptional regulator of viral defense system